MYSSRNHEREGSGVGQAQPESGRMPGRRWHRAKSLPGAVGDEQRTVAVRTDSLLAVCLGVTRRGRDALRHSPDASFHAAAIKHTRFRFSGKLREQQESQSSYF